MRSRLLFTMAASIIVVSVFCLVSLCQAQPPSIIPAEPQQEINRHLVMAEHSLQVGSISEAIRHINRVAFLYWEAGSMVEAISYFQQAIDLSAQQRNWETLSVLYSNLGLIYSDLGEHSMASKFFQYSLEARRSYGNKQYIVAGLADLAYLYALQGQTSDAIHLLEEALPLLPSINNERLSLYCLRLLEYCYSQEGRANQAREIAIMYSRLGARVLRLPPEGDLSALQSAAKSGARAYAPSDSFAQHFSRDIEGLRRRVLQDSLSLAVLHTDYQHLQQHTHAIESTGRARFIALIGLSIALTLLLILAIQTQRNRARIKRMLVAVTEEKAQKEELVERNSKLLSSSINFAKRMQYSIMASQQALMSSIPDSFVLLNPRTEVSGDFYWFRPIQNKPERSSAIEQSVLIATIDSTSQQIQGAFLSLSTCTILNKLVDSGVDEPDLLLNEYSREVARSLGIRKGRSNESIRIGICRVDLDSRNVSFAGAKSQLAYISNGDLHTIKGERFAIGDTDKPSFEATRHTITCQEPTWCYLFTDGFINQIGGSSAQRFTRKYFYVLLSQIHSLPADQQHDVLIRAFEGWKQSLYPQVDDVLVVGFRV